MRILFLVQGEGRGHMTQALALAQIVQAAGHDLVGGLVGVTQGRPVPAFFADAFPAPIEAVNSPALIFDTKTNELKVGTSVLNSLKKSKVYFSSLRQIRDAIRRHRPDVVVNFYEILGGLAYARYRFKVPVVTVAHQYLAFHPAFPFPPDKPLDKQAFLLLSRINAWGARLKLALSFDELPDVPAEQLKVVPPLLRQEVLDRTPTTEPYLLAYVTQPGLRMQVEEAHRRRPDVPLRFFHSGVTEPEQVVDDTLTLHAIDGKRFLDVMQHCRAVVTTAGFESVCEAFYLGKPVLMIPQPNHYEQEGNALDGQRVGVGIASDSFDLDRLMTYLPNHDPAANARFRQWHSRCAELFLGALEGVVRKN